MSESNILEMGQNLFILNKDILNLVLEQVIYKGGKDNFAIFMFKSEFYIQIAAARGSYEMYCEAVSDNYLEGDFLLTKEQKDKLKKLGWNDPINSKGNYHLTHPVDSELAREELVELLLKTVNEAYNSVNIESNIILNLN